MLLEDGSELPVAGTLPAGVPDGYHRLVMSDGTHRDLVTSPRRCHLPAGLHGWGWAVQLYALRSARSWGMGDLGDLRALGAWVRRAGAGVALVNPLHAPLPRLPQEPSPYFPSSRIFRNPLYLDIRGIPGADDEEVVRAAREARRLNTAAVIDRDRVFTLKMRALDALWQRFGGDRGFDRYCAREGQALLRYASFCVLSERFAGSWRAWPQEYRHPDAGAVARVAGQDRRRVDFHRWLQWLLERQLDAAGGQVRLVHDLAVGFSPDGADAWLWQDLLAPGVRIGAPPDEFNLGGQDWGLAAFDPHRLRAAAYRPFRETLRAVMRRDAAVRIDHVMGLFRLWWVPESRGAHTGVYVRYPAREVLDIVALESARARCVVVGEDLGTVEAGVRAELRRRAVLSYRVAWFEDRAPEAYPRQALAALTTHDLPTTAGVWTGADLAEMRAFGVEPNVAAERRVRRRLRRLADSGEGAAVGRVVERAYAALSAAPSMLVVAALDDAASSARRPNMPGAMARPNWSLPLPRTLEQLRRDDLPRRIAGALGRR